MNAASAEYVPENLVHMDEESKQVIPTKLFDGVGSFFRRILIQVLSFGPMPRHVAFIPDGNRRYGQKWKIKQGEVHRIGFLNIMSIVKCFYEMGIKCISIYGFSIDNFRRKPHDVQAIKNLIQDTAEALMHDTSIVNELGIHVKFLGNLDLFEDSIREMIERAMDLTARNDKIILLVCLSYTSTHEIVHGVQGSCEERRAVRVREGTGEVIYKDGPISLEDVEKHMYYSGHSNPDILIRTSGETRLSNFLLWQSKCCLLYAPRCLWPEISFRHLVWAVLEYQRKYGYLEKIKKKLS